MKHIVIAIDGPAASGKSTLTNRLARHLGYAAINSGVFYRLVTWAVLEAGINPLDTYAVEGFTDELEFQIDGQEGGLRITLVGVEGEPDIRSEAVNAAVSKISAHKSVREQVTAGLRSLGDRWDCVIEGRDIGTAVFPDTPYKIYLDAPVDVRSARRAAQGEVDNPAARDAADSSRTYAPLSIAREAAVIDVSSRTREEVVCAALEALSARGLKTAVVAAPSAMFSLSLLLAQLLQAALGACA